VADAASMPSPPLPRGHYAPAVVHGGLVFTAGMTPRRDGELASRGTVGADLSAAEGRAAARLAAANALSAAARAAGGLDRIERCLTLTVYIVCVPGFTEHSAVADGASSALAEWLDDRGTAARAAIGVASLPSGAPVEVQLVAAIRAPAENPAPEIRP
jgi:enamine deaminase RidA (YjgF/YER057c/UK114 family)